MEKSGNAGHGANAPDGSLAPVLIRLAWHASGTYDKETKTGGSNYATMRFKPEAEHGANNGLVRVYSLSLSSARPSSLPLSYSLYCWNAPDTTWVQS